MSRRSVEFTDEGISRFEAISARFGKEVKAAAIRCARRRGAKEVDNTGVEAAYDYLVKASPRTWHHDLFADVVNLIAGGTLGYAVGLLTADPPVRGPGWALILASIVMGSFAGFVKYAPPKR